MILFKLFAIFAAICLLLLGAVIVILTLHNGKIEKELERKEKKP